MKQVYIVFLTEIDSQQHAILFQKQPQKSWKIPKTKITSKDFYSSSIAASKIILDQLQNIELQKFSFCKKEDLESVNFHSYEDAVKNYWIHSTPEEKQILRHSRNIQSYLWTHFFNRCTLWNDDEEINFYYIINCNQQDIVQLSNYKIVKVDDLANHHLKKQKQFTELKNSISNKDYLRVDGRIILHFNFKQKQHSVYEGPGYLDTVAIYNGVFRRRYDNWNQYDVAQNHYPSEEILRKAHLILMPGNRVSVYQNYQWIKDVKGILQKAYQINEKIKILGICFGFQILIEALGGKVEKMQQHGFIYGATILNHNLEIMKKFKLFQGLNLKQTTIINQAHGDEITKHSDLFILLSSSDSCKNEVMISKDERILLFQGHPEYTTEGMRLLSLSSRLPSNHLSLEQAISSTQEVWKHQEDPFQLELCLKFVKLI